MSEPRVLPGEDVAEACADALLAACAQVLILRAPLIASTDPVQIDDCRALAFQMINRVIERTYREGARPR